MSISKHVHLFLRISEVFLQQPEDGVTSGEWPSSEVETMRGLGSELDDELRSMVNWSA
ncbi:hypothetical protein P3T18_001241 [Paraburkholderia sp. GAS199]|uniref:hypothetical protein n=1 Tax=Paraburkholderia sp. GAS199 TaxID=3035126 RepID=UPI003D1F1A81